MNASTVTVPLGDRSYDIHIGEALLEKAWALLTPLLKRPSVVIVTDETVFAAQGERLLRGFAKAGVHTDVVTLAPGEQTKSFAELERLTARLLTLGVERDDIVVAFGGGVIGDLTGFACAILRRGCRFAQIPTTLLAQVDSAVGGKTAINTPQGKNLVGAFYQPCIVIADTSALDTLPPRQLRAGYAEVVKYGLICDAPFFAWLEKNGKAVLDGDQDARIHAVKTSCAVKAAVVGDDERERGKRALLNLGHTFGHAFEAHFGFSDRLLHGEAVALGMALAFEYAARSGSCAKEDAERVKAHLTASGLPSDINAFKETIPAETIIKYMMQDKKIEQGKLTLILAKSIGEAFIAKDSNLNDVLNFLKERTGR